MNNNFLCSIIVPVYNVVDYIDECISSVISQTYDKWELLLIDDGSTDGSEIVCNQYEEMDKRIRTIHQKNLGQSVARNTGIDSSTGDYIAFLDADDVLHKDFLMVLVGLMTEKEADLVCCGVHRGNQPDWSFYKNEKIIIRKNQEILKKMFLNDGLITVIWNKLYDAKLFKNTQIRFLENTNYEDLQIMPHILHITKKMIITNCPLYFYRQRQGSITKSGMFSKRRLDLITIVEDRLCYLKKLNEVKLYYIELAGYLRKLIRYREKMDKYNHDNNEDKCALVTKLYDTYHKYKFNPRLKLKVKINAIMALKKYKSDIQ